MTSITNHVVTPPTQNNLSPSYLTSLVHVSILKLFIIHSVLPSPDLILFLDSHWEKTTGTSGALIIWHCCCWNKLLVHLARGEPAPRLSLVSPKVFFSPFCHRWSFSSLPLSPLACLVGDTSFPAISPTWLHRYYLNWTELDDDITEFNNEMPLTEKWAFNLVILH